MGTRHHSTSDHSSIENTSAMICETDSQPRPPKKSVHFPNTCALNLIRMPTDKDRTNAWYQSTDYEQFNAQIMSVIKRAQELGVKAIEDMLDDGQSDGLECMISKKRAQVRLRRRYSVWDCVIDGQDNHETPERIAESCSAVSSGSSRDARRSALIHMAAVKPNTAAAPDKKKEPEQTSKHVLVGQHAQNTRAAGTTRRLYQSVVRSSGQRPPRTSRG